MVEHAKWQWQESGTAWRGVGVYHITLTVMPQGQVNETY